MSRYERLVLKHLSHYKGRGFRLVNDRVYCDYCEYSIKIDKTHIKTQLSSHLRSQRHHRNEAFKTILQGGGNVRKQVNHMLHSSSTSSFSSTNACSTLATDRSSKQFVSVTSINQIAHASTPDRQNPTIVLNQRQSSKAISVHAQPTSNICRTKRFGPTQVHYSNQLQQSISATDDYSTPKNENLTKHMFVSAPEPSAYSHAVSGSPFCFSTSSVSSFVSSASIDSQSVPIHLKDEQFWLNNDFLSNNSQFKITQSPSNQSLMFSSQVNGNNEPFHFKPVAT